MRPANERGAMLVAGPGDISDREKFMAADHLSRCRYNFLSHVGFLL
jgi:hypothetical protein